ncbi:phospholipase D-like domain-containing protein, partial [Muricoccus aerilatus]|uniref:phospholipase D-like domain-containing protein n=1 Tax=Muricoccus aerilatus TaxID=452982 RepID=UPI0005C25CFA
MKLSAGILLSLTAVLLNACVSAPTPGVSPDLLAARAAAAPGQSIDLMRQQSERFAGVPFISGNRVDLLVDGPAIFAALEDAIRSARTRIDMESYEFDEKAGGQFAELLLAARRRGVEVNLIYDAWGAVNTPAALFDRLRQGGVQVLEFNPLRPNERVPVSLNKRDHRKLLCVDGRVAITGGANISEVYQNSPKPHGTDPDDQAWRDTSVRIEGP